jgi:hypothetical protein
MSNIQDHLTSFERQTICEALLAVTPSGGGDYLNNLRMKLEHLWGIKELDHHKVVDMQLTAQREVGEAI